MAGLYTGASGLIANMLKLNTHSNNIANASTNGFKKDQETFKVFDETFKKAFTSEGTKKLGEYNDQVHVDNIQTYFEEGTAKITGNPYDFMISDGNDSEFVSFFTVSHGGNEYLTRNGGFDLDATRTLSTPNGGRVLDINNEPIVIPEGVELVIDKDGVMYDQKTNKEIARMKIQSVSDSDLQLLEKKQGNYFEVMDVNKIIDNFGNLNKVLNDFDNNPTLRSVFGSKERIQDIINTGNVNILNEGKGSLRMNMIETSNVDMATELVGLMTSQKNINSNQKVNTIMDKIFEREANDIGK